MSYLGRKTVTKPIDLGDGRALASRRVIEVWSGHHPETIRKRCQPIACHARNRALLYDAYAVIHQLGASHASTVAD